MSVDRKHVRDPRFLLLYPPLQFADGETAKPDGSLSLAYLAGALRRAHYDVKIFDCAVGEDGQALEETFFRTTSLPNGLRRVGIAPSVLLELASEYDVIGISSIFTPQTGTCLETVRSLKRALPDKLFLAGGVNARSLRKRFFDAGVDVIALSESELTIVSIARALQGKGKLSEVSGIAYRDDSGREVVNPATQIVWQLDELPMPAWDLLPLAQYWAIARPHGGNFPSTKAVRYASLQTSRGCPFRCSYCHISEEEDGADSGNIGAFRTKSIARVVEELNALKKLGVEQIFIEDDSLFAKKRRALELFKIVKGMGFELLDVNGVNLCHLYTRKRGELVVDTELIDAMASAGFSTLALPFESASQRVIDKYASGKVKVDPTGTATATLLSALGSVGIRASGNYMLGYPDETMEEIFATIRMARRHVDSGLDYALFFNVVPFPGTKLHDFVIREGYLDPEFDPDTMRWTKSIMRNLATHPDALEQVRQLAWLMVNRPEYIDYKMGMTMGASHLAPLRTPARQPASLEGRP